ncbi:MAG: 5'/3'-nucleotidase SurE [Candidatus Thorarchaeota archaeon]
MPKDSRPHIFFTNDDSARSPAFQHFVKELKQDYKLTILVPDKPVSGISKTLTFNEPIRFIKGESIDGQSIIETTGTPADAVTWCRTYIPDIDLVISGPNLGLNVSAHSILTSGTVGAAIEAALWKIPAIAFSIGAPSHTWFIPGESNANYQKAAQRARIIIGHVLSSGWPKGTSFLNVSFPTDVNENTPIVVAKPTPVRFINRLRQRKDPHGMEYYWIVGKEKSGIPKTSDVYQATTESKIVISPISLALSDDTLLESARQFLNPLLTML